MATEKVKFDIKVFDNFIEITPKDGVKDNSIYEIRLKGVKGTRRVEVSSDTIKFATAMTPSYCSIMDVSSLMEIVDIPEDIILYNIREASRYIDYVYERVNNGKRISANSVPFVVKEFVRYKAAKDCLIKLYMSLIADKTIEGTLGEVKFKNRESLPDIKDLLDYLDDEIRKWLDAVKGYHLEGRARMRTAIRGYHHGGINPMTSAEIRTTPKRVNIGMNRGVY